MTHLHRKATAVMAAAATLFSGCVVYTTPAFAQARAMRANGPCGAQALTGRAPDVMTYDPKTGTQVFLDQSGKTSVTAYNQDTRSVAHMSGDLAKPGVAETCAQDGTPGGNAYSAREIDGKVVVSALEGKTGDRWQTDGEQILRSEHDCFKAGLGLFAGTSRDMQAFGPAVSAERGSASAGLAVGDKMLGLSVRNGQIVAGVLPC